MFLLPFSHAVKKMSGDNLKREEEFSSVRDVILILLLDFNPIQVSDYKSEFLCFSFSLKIEIARMAFPSSIQTRTRRVNWGRE